MIYGSIDSNIRIHLLPWIVDPSFGNVDNERSIFFRICPMPIYSRKNVRYNNWIVDLKP